ncbi:hypothetical protein HO173_013043 [Letharia columbiana]|uniref:FHA domain-containing protein n=1 Tax=Letharia columbiana TaxID=112416 RepID=A0A8H6FDX8_9LECA|nr:uncharacterized protein HO173_013043 [Letharia columbiana]KAF6224526.1 hypothetical protein HO173_013043 [Letharia columbiana]
MWTLECDSNILDSKRIWLRPGKKYLFGRTLDLSRGRNKSFQLKDEKSVSRQHLTLTVSAVKPGDGSLVHTRSEIALKDEATKFGTEVDGVRIKENERVLKDSEHTFRLGKSNHIFRIKWQPVVFTFSLSSKEMKTGKDPLLNYRNRLEDLDIKVVIPYIVGVTTHVVSTKRNTAKGLQALINGKYIVTETYIDALVYATTPENLDELESLSPLEEDFDAHWPNASEHLPAKSKEPSERPSEDFVPNSHRDNVFEGYTFVFLDATQFETLQAPITNGGGKALSFIPNPGKTTAEEIVRYVKGVAGEKGLGEFEDGSEGKGVVVIRFRLKEKFADWAAQMDTTISLALGQRLIEQSEFIEAILLNDASILRRPLEVDYEESAPRTNGMIAPAALAEDVMQVETLAQPEVSKPAPRRARVRGNVVSRFKGFGADDDDESSMPTSSRPAPVDSQMEYAPLSGRSQRYSNGASLADSPVEIDSQNQENGEDEATKSRKRPASTLEEVDEDEMMDSLLPAATAMKKRRIEEAESFQRDGVPREQSFETSQKKAKKENTRQPPKEVNIKEALRERREREEKEEAARRDEENPRETIDGMSIDEMKKLAIVEPMDVLDRSKRTQRREHDNPADSRWDERWNGRKNFKKFRRRGEGTQARRGQSVIVPLEEVKRKDFGIGQGYWVESEKTKKRRKENERTTQSQSQSQPFATAKSEAVEGPSELVVDGDIPVSSEEDAPRITLHQERTQQTDESSNRSQVVNGKRPAASQANGGPAKKQKTFAVQDSDSDSEDELKFRFKKKGR